MIKNNELELDNDELEQLQTRTWRTRTWSKSRTRRTNKLDEYLKNNIVIREKNWIYQAPLD
jgi:hypothetical protein